MSAAVLPIGSAEMNVAALRLDVVRPTVEALLARIDRLARERQELRSGRATPGKLERNRLALVRSQWELSYALIERHVPCASARDAA
jgi:hypothetical protein